MAEFVTSTLMDSYAGGPHVTEVQLGLANQADFGPDDYVLEGGRESEAQILTNNSIRIFDAVYCLQGRRDVVPASGYSDVTIVNGAQGMNRNDIIVRRYKKDESSEIESTEYAVIKGESVAGEAEDPEVTVGNIRSGATLHEMKLYRVKIEGLNITAVEPLFQVLKSKITLQKEIAQTNKDLIDSLNPDFPIIATSYGLQVNHTAIGRMHFMRIAGNTNGALTTHTITLPEKYSGGFYVIDSGYAGNYRFTVEKSGTKLAIASASGQIPAKTYLCKWIMYYN